MPRLETNSVINLCANVRLMGLTSIIPEYFLDVIGPISDVRAVQLSEPAVEHSVNLVALDRDPISPLVLAAFECAKAVEPPAMSKPSPAASPGVTGVSGGFARSADRPRCETSARSRRP